MKTRIVQITCGFVFLLSFPGFAQISNLSINGSTASFAMVSGDSMTWSFNVAPIGASASIEIWYDANGNGTIDPATDVLWQTFLQTDGDTNGGFGPSDADGVANGVVSLAKTPIGLAPGKYILKFSQGGTSLSMTGTITALTSPAHTISGTVMVPAGRNASKIFVGAQASSGDHRGPGWWSLTDASGNYQIAMNADTSGGPWRVYLGINPFPPGIITPSEQYIAIVGNPTGINFAIVAAAAQVAGTVKDDNGSLIIGAYVTVSNNVGDQFTSVQTNTNGFYQIGLPQSRLTGNTGFAVVAYFEGSSGTTNRLDGFAVTGTMSPGDSVVRNLISYTANSTISGTVRVNGVNPGVSIQLAAVNQDSAASVIWTNSATGAFSFPVTNKIFNYKISSVSGNIYHLTSNPVLHPGQTGVIVDLSTTEVTQLPNLLPAEWSLVQNYPNPFNPSTTIRYTLPSSSRVKLTIYNVLGQVVSELANQEQSAGWKEVQWRANVASGIYFYRIYAISTTDPNNRFMQVKKMLLLK